MATGTEDRLISGGRSPDYELQLQAAWLPASLWLMITLE
jgi:hypothetical protein